jgi:hypothetical protein
MIRMVIHKLLARLEFFPSTKTLIARIPVHEYRGITIQKTYMDPKTGEVVVEMAANSRETKLDEFSCSRC